MSRTIAATDLAATPITTSVTATGQPRPETSEGWAEGRLRQAPPPRLAEDARAIDTSAEEALATEGRARRLAGTHLLIDLWDARGLDDLGLAEDTLREAVSAVGATLLHLHLHHFTINNGVSGVAVLAESHISIHTWPERGYAALDIFVCGDSDPRAALPVFRRAWSPARMEVRTCERGLVE